MNALAIQGLELVRAGGFRLSIPSLSLSQGEQALLVAPSGGGKSTLLHLIAGLEDPDAGSIAIADMPISSLRGAARDAFRGASIGMVFQTFNLLHGFSAIENLMVAMMFSSVPEATHEARARALLSELGIDRPEQSVETMSVGQQQRVAVARALACRPTLVLADEPTASLDPANAAAAIGLLQRACRDHGAALLCTSHDPSLREHFSRVIDLGTVEAAR
ncbi:MAG: ATP-binding cassette domain-containing protein [Phycisphaerae bacterium]|nr:ATP-binding cassette domain-containing protein [Phycisphaerae bacterium]